MEVPLLEIYFAKLVMIGVLEEVPHTHMDSVVGDWDILSSLKKLNSITRNPTMNEAKALSTELALLPFAMTNSTLEYVMPPKSMLLFGSRGTGKTLLMRALVTHSKATFFNLSPARVFPRIKEAGGSVREVFKIAREFQPAIVYIDQCEMFLMGPTAKKKKKGKKKSKKKKKKKTVEEVETAEHVDKRELAQLVGEYLAELQEQINLLKPTDRIFVIGESKEPWDVEAPALLELFHVPVHAPRPNHIARMHLFQKYISALIEPASVETVASSSSASMVTSSSTTTTTTSASPAVTSSTAQTGPATTTTSSSSSSSSSSTVTTTTRTVVTTQMNTQTLTLSARGIGTADVGLDSDNYADTFPTHGMKTVRPDAPYITSSPLFNLSLISYAAEWHSPRTIRTVCHDILTPSRLARLGQDPITTGEFIARLKKYPTVEAEEKKLWEDFIPMIPKPMPEYIQEDPDAKKKKRF